MATAATAYVMIVALPNANQTFREITFNVIAAKAEGDVKPRVFFVDFPNRVLYVRDIQPATGWRDVFLADASQPDQTTVYLARQGRLLIDRAQRTVQLVLENGTRHTTFVNRPEEYEPGSFQRLVLNMDADAVFPRTEVVKGVPEMTIAELRLAAAEHRKNGVPAYSELFMIQQKFSLPAACLVLALIGLGLGASNRKDGKLASFALGFGVIFVYYVLLYSARAAALGGRLSPSLAPWVVNALLGAAGIALVAWRVGAADAPIRITLPRFGRGRDAAPPTVPGGGAGARRPVRLVLRIPHVDWPRPRLLDLYVARQYLSVFGLSFVSLVGIFYISTFIDLADKLFRGAATTGMLLRFFYFQTPQFVYYVIPLSALVASLVTIGLLTKNSELIIMRACGVSLYRSAAPLLLFAALLSGVLFELQERVLAGTNQEAARLNGIMRGYPMQTFGVFNRRWMLGTHGDIYRYEYFDPRLNQFSQLSIFHLNESAWRLDSLTYALEASLVRQLGTDPQPTMTWEARKGWSREFTTATRRKVVRPVVTYTPFARRSVSLEQPSYFKTDEPEADRMTYAQLKSYISQLQASGYRVVPYLVQLQRKIAFPFVTLIMTLLAVPFAVTTGRRGALYGIGVGLVLAMIYWTALSVFGAIGAGGAISPMLAAWAPNILFSAAALYMVLTVRT